MRVDQEWTPLMGFVPVYMTPPGYGSSIGGSDRPSIIAPNELRRELTVECPNCAEIVTLDVLDERVEHD